MSRKPFIAGNWKMHNTIAQAVDLAQALKQAQNKNNAEIAVAPSFTALNAVAQVLKGGNINTSAQDCYFEEKGAFTSQIAPGQVKEAGATHIILGHSERRSLFGDTDEILNKKLAAALKHGLKVIFCVGETLVEREMDRTMIIIQEQLEGGLKNFTAQDLKDLIIAYEPVWAIGTGKTATPQQAQEVHKEIRAFLEQKFDATFAQAVRIIYGGSGKADNIDDIMTGPDVDGALVGGQSLEADKFIRIIDYN